jgi:hypothetical protein
MGRQGADELGAAEGMGWLHDSSDALIATPFSRRC